MNDSREPQPRKPPNDRREFLFGKARVLTLVFVAAALLTIYIYLDQQVFAPNRPLIWQTFEAKKISQDIQQDKIVVIVAGEFQDPDSRSRHADFINVPEVRREAHRLRTVFTVLPLEKLEENDRNNRNWLSEQIKPAELSADPHVWVFYKKSNGPKCFKSQVDVAGHLAAYLKAIRKNELAK